jgi:hypothetical protein
MSFEQETDRIIRNAIARQEAAEKAAEDAKRAELEADMRNNP